MSLAAILARDDVREESTLRSSFGICAYHGGMLERATDVIAREAAATAGASYYGILLPDDPDLHLPSTEVKPDESETFRAFMDHVDTIVTVHGYGRHDQLRTVLLGGHNRSLAASVGSALRIHLGDEFSIVDEMAQIPAGLRGLHEQNPVNRPINAGVQIELGPGLRWNRAEQGWSDCDGIGRATQVDQVIAALVEVVKAQDVR
ncbi:MAG: poly-gamma-glutamate hydrolase family protein [Acidobacteria bacterium]|nr:poly-gamma-glutamate hydrolase family protein [Acidobacteriota bacterium]